MKIINYLALSILLFHFSTEAAWKDTHNVEVKLISVWASNGGVLVQTNPKPNIEGLSCSDNYWLSLGKSSEGYDALLSLLLTAQASKQKITVRANNNGSEPFCRLERVIILSK